MKWYKRYADLAYGGMACLTLEECGAYNRIIDQSYSRDGIIPDDDRLLARIVGCSLRKWRVLKSGLLGHGKIWIADGRIRVKRVELTIFEAENFSKLQRKRVNKRWKSTNGAYQGGINTLDTIYNRKKERLESLSDSESAPPLATALPAGALAAATPKPIHELTAAEVLAQRRKKAAADKASKKGNGADPSGLLENEIVF